ncbi:MAG TPA: hypothetical protein VJH88_04945 [Candidatus Nanoarchaeia archaeon]|nr:hypothetical protein [Candidatus Nanoarchaeia archaeon]
MSHYICAGECGGVSKSPKNCGADVCNKKSMPLLRCNCKDKAHRSAAN